MPLPPLWEKQDPLFPYPGYFPDHPEQWLIERHRRHKEMARNERDTIRIVFLGDSITQDWEESLWNTHFAPRGAINFGIGGDKTCQILWRIQDGLLDGLKPDLIVLAIGVNSIWSGAFQPEHIGDGVISCVSAIQAVCPEAKILVSGVLPCMESPDHPYRTVIRGINARASNVDNASSIRFIDAGTALLESDGFLPITIAYDGVHLTVEGYRRFATVLLPAMEEILAAT